MESLPPDSDNLADRLKKAYPECTTLRERKHKAAIDFLVQELDLMQDEHRQYEGRVRRFYEKVDEEFARSSVRNVDYTSLMISRLFTTPGTSMETTTVYEIPIVLSEEKNMLPRQQEQIDALGDYCAKFNFIREDYATRLGLKINRNSMQTVKIGSGNRITTVGTTTLPPFRFQDETELHSPLFHVLPKCLHNVILGRSFLKATRTFSSLSNFARRVKERVLRDIAYHFLYLGDSMPRFSGLVNGKPKEALADSGAKVLVMDEDFAQRNNLSINRNSKYRTTLRFADDSTAETAGMVHGVEWEFGPGGEGKYILDFHVLQNAPADVILSDTFLFGTNAFSRFDCYLVDEDDEDEDAFFFAIDVDRRQRHRSSTVTSSVTAHARHIELVLRGKKDDEISNLPIVEQATARAKELDRRAAWDIEYARVQQTQTQPTSSDPITLSQPNPLANANLSSPQPTSTTAAQESSQWRRFKLKLKRQTPL